MDRDVDLEQLLKKPAVLKCIQLGDAGFEQGPSQNHLALMAGITADVLYSIDFDQGGQDPKTKQKTPIGIYITTADKRFFISAPELVRALLKLGSN